MFGPQICSGGNFVWGVNIFFGSKEGERFRLLACADTGARTPLRVHQYLMINLQITEKSNMLSNTVQSVTMADRTQTT